ncbi:partitioning defective 3 related [Anaeramoeba flamelloides]|uniref:Partitioning defective 3 related n=1 Tax=Anaeramoeba flamelloides TaxID=1746091 RepID=A0AAV8A424_9EUKA|nr:partitioning defective 3 related [Anaeramoeba flamelloides]
MSQYSFSTDLLSQDLPNIKKDFQGITSFRERLKKLQKFRPSSIIGLNSSNLNKGYLKNKCKKTLPTRIEIRRDCITDLVLLCSKPKKSIERGLATFFKKYYLLKNVSNYSREWLVFGSDNENRKKTDEKDKTTKMSKQNSKTKLKQKLKKNKKQKLKLKHKPQLKYQKKKRKNTQVDGKPLTFNQRTKKKNPKRRKNTKKKSAIFNSLFKSKQHGSSRKRRHHDSYRKKNYLDDLGFHEEKITHSNHLYSFGSLNSSKKRKQKRNRLRKSSHKHSKKSLKKKRLNQGSSQKFSPSKTSQKKTKPIKKKIVLCQRYHSLQQIKQKQNQIQSQEVIQEQKQKQKQKQEQEQEQEHKTNNVQEQKQEQEQEQEEFQIQIQGPLELFSSPIQDYGMIYPPFKFDTDQLEDDVVDFGIEEITNTRNSFDPFIHDIFEDADLNLVLFQQDEGTDTQTGFLRFLRESKEPFLHETHHLKKTFYV